MKDKIIQIILKGNEIWGLSESGKLFVRLYNSYDEKKPDYFWEKDIDSPELSGGKR